MQLVGLKVDLAKYANLSLDKIDPVSEFVDVYKEIYFELTHDGTVADEFEDSEYEDDYSRGKRR